MSSSWSVRCQRCCLAHRCEQNLQGRRVSKQPAICKLINCPFATSILSVQFQQFQYKQNRSLTKNEPPPTKVHLRPAHGGRIGVSDGMSLSMWPLFVTVFAASPTPILPCARVLESSPGPISIDDLSYLPAPEYRCHLASTFSAEQELLSLH